MTPHVDVQRGSPKTRSTDAGPLSFLRLRRRGILKVKPPHITDEKNPRPDSADRERCGGKEFRSRQARSAIKAALETGPKDALGLMRGVGRGIVARPSKRLEMNTDTMVYTATLPERALVVTHAWSRRAGEPAEGGGGGRELPINAPGRTRANSLWRQSLCLHFVKAAPSEGET